MSKTKLFLVIVFLLRLFFFETVKKTDTAALILASAVLSNPRLSYRSIIQQSTPSGTSTIEVETTNNLFVNDSVCFVLAGESGCHGGQRYVVSSIIDQNHFKISPALTTNLTAVNDFVVSIQSGSMTIKFNTVGEVPVNGSIFVSIPGVKSDKANDGIPDTSSSIMRNGFDANNINITNIKIFNGNGSDDSNWTKTFTSGTAIHDHQINFKRTGSALNSNAAISIVIDKTPGMVNPAPIQGSITGGKIDVYTINVKTRDTGDHLIDEVDIDIGPTKPVTVAATVKEMFTFIIAGVGTETTTCGAKPDEASTSTSVPFGLMSSPDSFKNLSQRLTVITNVANGYFVTIEENDQMGKDGNPCPGLLPGTDEISFGNNKCIRDTICDNGQCSESVEKKWNSPRNHGLGYSLKNDRLGDAIFEYQEGFYSRQLPDVGAGKTKQTIIQKNGPTDGSSVFVCYRLSVPANQPAGSYFNKVRYTAQAAY